MARKSRVLGNAEETAPVKEMAYLAGIYVRLSSEESGEDALENQAFLLRSYVERQTDMRLAETYTEM